MSLFSLHFSQSRFRNFISGMLLGHSIMYRQLIDSKLQDHLYIPLAQNLLLLATLAVENHTILL
jgi:hypothetical protein